MVRMLRDDHEVVWFGRSNRENVLAVTSQALRRRGYNLYERQRQSIAYEANRHFRRLKFVTGLGFTMAVAPVWAQSLPARAPLSPNAQEDNWAFLANPVARDQSLDHLKYIPLGDGDGSYVSFGGSIRTIARAYDDESFGDRPGQDDTYHLRVMGHVTLVTSDGWRVFAELKHAEVADEALPLPPVEEDALDLNQLFVERRFGAKSAHLIRVGRQELHYGRGLLVSVREGPNVRQSHDGVLFRAESGLWRTDAFIARAVTSDFGVFDDRREAGAALWAIYAAGKLRDGTELDIYYFGDRRRNRRYNSVTGDEIRHSFGARYARSFPGGLVIDAEAVVQLGKVSGVRQTDIRAWTAYGRIEQGFATIPGKPAIALEAGIASGDSNPGDGVLNTFRAPQPPGRYFGNATPLGPANLGGLSPSIAFDVAPKTRLTAQARFFWRVSNRDGIYSPPGFLLRPGAKSSRTFVGSEFGLTLVRNFGDYVSVRATAARFKAGAFLRETSPGKDVSLGELIVNFRF